VQSRLITVFLLAILSHPALAQLKLRLELPTSGTYRAWVATGPSQATLPEARPLQGPIADFEPGSFAPGAKLFVLEDASGNLAMTSIGDIKGSWKLSPGDFVRVGTIRIRIEYKGEPVESASIKIHSGKDVRSHVIGASNQGETGFHAVPQGNVEVVVQYSTTAGETPEPLKQSFSVPMKRTAKEPLLIVSIPDEVATIAAPSGAGATKSGEGKAEEPVERGGMGFLGRLVSFILALGVAVLLVYFGIKWMKSNQDQVQAKLSSLGVEIPGQNQEPPGDAHVPRAPIAPPPPEKIMLDDAAPTPLSAPVSMGTATITEPRLVSEDGSQIPLDEGSMSVGRDAGMGLSLLNESTVSRQHAELIRTGQTVVLKDLGSTNGTFVNGQKVDGEVELRPGDKVQFGAVRFRFEG
jgi:hypothetical protein